MSLSEKQTQFIRSNINTLSARKIAKATCADEADVRAAIKRIRTQTNVPKRKLFTLIAILIPALFFILLETGLRLANYDGNTKLFIPAHGDYANYYMCNPHVGRRYFFMQNTIPDPPNDLFLKQKPDKGYRIFVLGGSTTAGYPYGNNIMFPRILQKRLADTFPDKNIEVINTAMTAINSYTLLDFMDEIIEKQADAILIYAGHNEFYGALGAASNESLGKFRGFIKVYLTVQRFKFFILLRNWIGASRKWISHLLFKGDVSNPSATLMERMVSEQTILYGSPLYKLGRNQFEGNLRDILSKAEAAGLDIMTSELVSNIHDIQPFISVASDSLPAAKTIMKQAVDREKEGEFLEAKELYYRAKDLDALRFRATEDFNHIIHKVSEEFHVPVVPMKRYFEEKSPHGFIGHNLILEHLHPNVDGYFVMADAFYDTMQREKFISANWDSSFIKPASLYRENWGFTALDKAFCDLRIRILKGGWPFKPKSVPNRALVGYVPKTQIDSLAWEAWRFDSMNLERAHVKLAEFFESGGEYHKALEEYKALICSTPYNVSPYLYAAKMLIEARKLKQSIPFLQQSLKFEETAYATKWLGQIYLDMGQIKKSIPFLVSAVKKAPEDAQLLYNLSGAYALNHQYDLAKKNLKKLERIKPGFPGAADLKRQLENL